MRLALLVGLFLSSQALAGPRTTASIDAGWRFLRADAPGAEQSAFPDRSWDLVDLPHTWNAQDGTSDRYYRGVGWYRRHLAGGLARDERAYVRFGAASMVADVYVDGILAGHHDGGFTAFVVDVTDALRAGPDHVVAVRVSNAHDPRVAPLDADFTFFGGLYRDVELITTGAAHVSLLDHGASGVYGRLTSSTADRAQVATRVVLTNDGASATAVRLRVVLSDAAGRPVAEAWVPRRLAAAETAEIAAELTVPRPHLWDGRRDPYLYELRAEVWSGDGRQRRDVVAQPFGLRTVAVTPDGGFLLNGHPLELRGVNMHQDWPGQGWAVSHAERRTNVQVLLEMGANAVRLCHYPHSPDELDLLDRSGIVAWSEIPLVNTITPSQAFADVTKSQLVEMIRQLGNHPAIAFWGLFNEVKADPIDLVAALNALAHREDPSRPTTAASDRPLGFPLHPIPDTIAFNKYDGYYYRKLTDFGPEMDAARAAYPTQAIGVSEYGAGANIAQHQDPPPTDESPVAFHPEERQSVFHESFLAQLRARPALFGHFVWNLFDFASASRHEAGLPGINDKGLVTYDRQVRKDAFYLYKATWTDVPMLYITSRRFTRRTSADATVKVYANLSRITVTHDGQPLGEPTRHDGVVWEWSHVTLAPGVNRIEATGESGGRLLADRVAWTLSE